MRVVEVQKKAGKWDVVDTAYYGDFTAGAGNEYQTIVTGPDTMSKSSRLWLQIYPSQACTLASCAAKASYQ